jgi:small GTP-binding protein
MTAHKIMLLGEIGVGKSSIVRRLVLDKFDFDYKPTIGVDVYTYTVPDSITPGGMQLIVWDTDGNFGEAIFKHVYMKQASAAVIIGDRARPATLASMEKLGTGFRDAFPGRHYTYVANKCDLGAPEESETLLATLASRGAPLMQTSALTGDNVQEAFHDAARTLARRSVA